MDVMQISLNVCSLYNKLEKAESKKKTKEILYKEKNVIQGYMYRNSPRIRV